MKETNEVVDGNDGRKTPYAAVLLAGGKSTRMGLNKATLIFEGRPLWQRQIHLLQSLGAAEVYISGPLEGPWQGSGISVIEDKISGLGPMGALVSILPEISSSHVLILAVDLPLMTLNYLQKLIRKNRPVVPLHAGYLEPLAAIYPRSCLADLQQRMQNGQTSLQDFLKKAVTSGSMQTVDVTRGETLCFTNVNDPAGADATKLFIPK